MRTPVARIPIAKLPFDPLLEDPEALRGRCLRQALAEGIGLRAHEVAQRHRRVPDICCGTPKNRCRDDGAQTESNQRDVAFTFEAQCAMTLRIHEGLGLA